MNNGLLMHHIQRSIILSLARTSPLRFSDLQPPRIPNNTFSYHLKKLIDRGYVELTETGYIPTRKALKLVAYGSADSKRAHAPGPITMICVQNEDGEILLLNRNRKPFQGWYGVPGGWIHVGESPDDAALRELAEKTTLIVAENLEAAGVLDLRYIEPDTQDIFLHVIGFVYVYHFTGDKKTLSDKVTTYGQLSWSTLKGDNILPEVHAAKELVDKGVYACTSATYVEPPQLVTE